MTSGAFNCARHLRSLGILIVLRAMAGMDLPCATRIAALCEEERGSIEAHKEYHEQHGAGEDKWIVCRFAVSTTPDCTIDLGAKTAPTRHEINNNQRVDKHSY